YLETGYERARVLNSDGPKMRARSLYDMVAYLINPDAQELAEAEEEAIRIAVAEFREEQALHDEEMELNLAFLDRGAPERFVRNLFIKMRHGRRETPGPGRRKLAAGGGRHLEGLWEHEVGVDAVPVARGFEKRRFLKEGF
ncbi:hypothetical protein TeGR_g11475, partial [Tetraparma gracilis]